MNPNLNLIRDRISSASKILVNIHVGGDYDSVTSALAMKAQLEAIGKHVTVFSPERLDGEILANADLLAGFESIVYRSSSEITQEDFDLFICLDSEKPNRVARFDGISFPLRFPTIVIDHHVSNPHYGEINWIEGQTCTAEMILRLSLEFGWTVTPAVAKLLFIGIYSDTGRFIYPELVSPGTFDSVSQLARLGNLDLAYLMTRIRLMDFRILQSAGLAISRAKNYFGGKVLLSQISFADITSFGLEKDAMVPVKEFVCENLSYTRQPQIVGAIVERGQDWHKISLRSNNVLNFRDVRPVLEKFPGGGGHAHGGGADSKFSMEKTLVLLLEHIKSVYPDMV